MEGSIGIPTGRRRLASETCWPSVAGAWLLLLLFIELDVMFSP
jgi:hypothetical protein